MNKKNYVKIYSIVPTEYLNNSKLNSTEKLLLFHITALCKRNGYCCATNKYFVNIYNLSKTTISLSINKLVRLNILKSKIVKNDINSKKRYLTLVNDIWQSNLISINDNLNTGIEDRLTYNNKINKLNNTSLINNEEKNILNYDWLNDPDGWFDLDQGDK